VLTGAHGLAGQLGHAAVPLQLDDQWRNLDPGVRDITPPAVCLQCGRENCLQNVASGAAILNQLRRLDADSAPGTIAQLVDQVNSQQTERRLSYEAVVAAGARLGSALADVSLIVDPTRILIGGPLAATGGALINSLKASFAKTAFPGLDAEIVTVAPDRIGDLELVGAVALAHSRLDLVVP
jgi:predicted NBD/HSP70 family sugar kinase